jgi:hypothetical protein
MLRLHLEPVQQHMAMGITTRNTRVTTNHKLL